MPSQSIAHEAPDADRRSAVLTQSVVKAAEMLGIRNTELAGILGLSDATVSRMRKGEYLLASGEKPFELAQFLLRLFRSLDSITGGDDKASAAWMRAENLALGAVPIELVQTVRGMVDVVDYLDSRRGWV